MFERFSEGARQVAVFASQEGRQLGHQCIGTEHLLLGMLDDRTGGAAAILRRAGVTRERVREEIVRRVRTGPETLGESDADALRAIGIDLFTVRAKIEELFGPGALDDVAAPPRRRGLLRRGAPARLRGHLPFSDRAKKVLELSLRECVHLRHTEIRSEHVLLGLIREGQGLAARILVDSGVDLAELRRLALSGMAERAA